MLQLGRVEQAVESLSAAAAVLPGNADVHIDLGVALTCLARHADAEASFRRAATLEPGNPDTHLNLGNALAEQGKLHPALACYRRMLELDPGLGVAHFSIGMLHQRQGRLADAEAAYQAALATSPDHVGVLNGLGAICQGQGRYAEAISCYRRVIAIQPENVEALNNLGNTLAAQHHWDAAAVQYEHALEHQPSNAEARYNLALVRLFRLEFERAWTGFERRLECQDVRKTLRREIETVKLYERLASWPGPQEAGVRDVAIWAEQGIGDQILYSTLIPELTTAGVPFIYEVDSRILAAYRRSFPDARFVPLAEPPADALQGAERVLLAGSLPALFRRSRADFARQPQRLLSALPDRTAHYRSRLDAAGAGLKVALSWRSRNVAGTARTKSTDLVTFGPLLELPGVQFVDAQYGDTVEERRQVEAATGARLVHFDEVDYYNDLEELFAILEACDLVITTSSAAAHFAGALGKRTWLLYPGDGAPFFYWAHGGSCRSLWYPAVEIITAAHLDQWQPLIGYAAERLASELR
jgi:tetratricopeptide (TPR) repeat protein